MTHDPRDLRDQPKFVDLYDPLSALDPLLKQWLQLRFDFDWTAVRLQFDCSSTALRHSTTYVTTVDLHVCGLLHCDLNK